MVIVVVLAVVVVLHYTTSIIQSQQVEAGTSALVREHAPVSGAVAGGEELLVLCLALAAPVVAPRPTYVCVYG